MNPQEINLQELEERFETTAVMEQPFIDPSNPPINWPIGGSSF